jgi:tetratricopeptide (TPR) repeat protein
VAVGKITGLLIVNVVAIRSKDVGDYVYRVSQPSWAMGQLAGIDVATVGMLSPHLAELVLAADVAILHLLTEDDLFPLLAERRRLGKPTVYEISDNFVEPHPGVGIRGWFADPGNRANAFDLIGQADAVQVTGEGLRQAFGALNPRTVVFENQLRAPGPPPRPPGERVRLGWAGSVGHTEDLRPVAPVVAAAMDRHRGVEFAFMGSEGQFREVFGDLARAHGARVACHPPGSLVEYYRFLESLDVGLGPMNDNPYNRCRSDVKFVEYAGHGVVPVLSRITPYLSHAVDGETALLFGDPGELGRVLDRVLGDAGLRAAIAGRAHAYVSAERREEQHAAARVAFYREIGAEDAGSWASSLPLEPGEQGSHAYEVAEHRAEALLVEGIRLESQGKAPAARNRFRQASQRHPKYALPYFWLGSSHLRAGDEAQAERCFERAARADKRSLRTLLQLARLQGGRDRAQAQETLERALALAPDHAAVFVALGKLAERNREWGAAADHYQRALERNPRSAPAAAGLAAASAALGDVVAAQAALERTVALSPFDSRAHHALAAFLFNQGDLIRAAELCVRAVELDPGNEAARALMQQLLAATAGL